MEPTPVPSGEGEAGGNLLTDLLLPARRATGFRSHLDERPHAPRFNRRHMPLENEPFTGSTSAQAPQQPRATGTPITGSRDASQPLAASLRPRPIRISELVRNRRDAGHTDT
jgi:hypothetical protein